MAAHASIDKVRGRLAVGAPAGIRLGPPRAVGGLTLVPIFHDGLPVEYELFAEAQRAGTAEVTEVGAEGAVPVLEARSSSQVPVLLVEGEILTGLKQNRVLNTTILVPPRTTLEVPVACVEAGRWHRATGKAKRADYSLSAKLRAFKKPSEVQRARSTGHFMADQEMVWQGVAQTLGSHGVSSPTFAYSEIEKARGNEIEDLLHSLEPLPGQAGVLAYLGGEPLSLDVFDRASTLTHLWHELAGSYVVDALISDQRGKTIGLDEAAVWIGSLVEGETSCHPGVGLGETVLITSPRHCVSALVEDGVPVHIAAYPR